MSTKLKVRSPAGKIELHTIQNGNDLVQHMGWERLGPVTVDDGVKSGTTAQEVIDNSKKIAAVSESSEPIEVDDEPAPKKAAKKPAKGPAANAASDSEAALKEVEAK